MWTEDPIEFVRRKFDLHSDTEVQAMTAQLVKAILNKRNIGAAKAQDLLASYLNKVLELITQQNSDARYKEVGYFALTLAINKMEKDSALAE